MSNKSHRSNNNNNNQNQNGNNNQSKKRRRGRGKKNNQNNANNNNMNNNNNNNINQQQPIINNKPKPKIDTTSPSSNNGNGPKLSWSQRTSAPSSKNKRHTSLRIGGISSNGINGSGSSSSPVSLHGNMSKDDLLKIRMQQRDICYVAGLPKSICNRQILASKKWFGQFGKIRDITITDNQNCIRTNWMCVHIKYFENIAAAKAVKIMNHKKLDDGRVLEANYGTQRYCEFFINNKKCHKNNCPFRHNWCKLNEIVNFNNHHQIIPNPYIQSNNNNSYYQQNNNTPKSPQRRAPISPQRQQPQAQTVNNTQNNIQQPEAKNIRPRPSPPPDSNNGNNNNNMQQQQQTGHPSINSVPSTHSSTDLAMNQQLIIHSDENTQGLQLQNDNDPYIRSQTKSIHGDECGHSINNSSLYGVDDELNNLNINDMNDQQNNINIVHEQQMEMHELYEELQMVKEQNSNQKEDINKLNDELQLKESEMDKLRKISQAISVRFEDEKRKNDELLIKNKEWERKYDLLLESMKELEHQMNTMQNSYNKERDLNLLDYTLWQSNDVYQWIMTIHGGKFQKYSQNLKVNIDLENIDGSCLKILTTTDIHRWGISDFKDKQILLESIKHLKSNLGLDQIIFNEDGEIAVNPHEQQQQQQNSVNNNPQQPQMNIPHIQLHASHSQQSHGQMSNLSMSNSPHSQRGHPQQPQIAQYQQMQQQMHHNQQRQSHQMNGNGHNNQHQRHRNHHRHNHNQYHAQNVQLQQHPHSPNMVNSYNMNQ